MDATLAITPAAEVALTAILKKRGGDNEALVLGVRKGGCAGWQYTMQIGESGEGDVRVSRDKESAVFIAADSLDKLNGCHLDYSDALSDAGFKITNPQAARSCGCGTSFETADESENSTYDPEMDGIACS